MTEKPKKITEWILGIWLLFGLLLLIPIGLGFDFSGEFSFLQAPYLLALTLTWIPPILYYFIRGRTLPFRILDTLKFHGRTKVSDLATRFSTREADIESAIVKLKSRKEPIQLNEKTGKLVYIPLRRFIGIIDVVHTSKDYTLFLTSKRMIVARITRNEIDKLKHISPDNILRTDAYGPSFSIPYSRIVRVEIKKHSRGRYCIHVVTYKERYEFVIRGSSLSYKPFGHHYHTGKKLIDDCENLMRSVLPDKLSMSWKEREATTWELEDQLIELKEQLSLGAITQEEYEQKKKKLLEKSKV